MYKAFALSLLFLFPLITFADVVADRRAALEAELVLIEQQIAQQQVLLDDKSRERTSLERDVAILDAQIKKSELQIQARTIEIQKLNTGISQKQETIGELGEKLIREKNSLAQLFRKTDRIDDASLIEIVLSGQTISDFFGDLDTFSDIKLALTLSFGDLEYTRVQTEEEKVALTDRRAEELELKSLQELERQKIAGLKAERQKILDISKGEEAAYQTLVNTIKKTAAEIRTELFSLRDSAAIPFGEALALAEKAGEAVGVRPAVILGVLKQETRLGEFLGTGIWEIDMHPTRDAPIFPYIMAEIGLDPDSVPVSKAPSYGWGGAMGPSQFIPSTWVCYGGFINTNTGDCNNAKRSMTWDDFWQGPWEYRANKDRIRNALGSNRVSNPYNNQDAFTATGMLMADNGADAGTWAAERLAALRYFAGWTNATKSQYAFYGDSVMEHADFFQEQIDILYGS
jgi:peptidoglycan hydrolase CwlO-like protein